MHPSSIVYPKVHVRKLDAISSNLLRSTGQYSREFLSSFSNLLRLNHREKSVGLDFTGSTRHILPILTIPTST